MTAALVVGIAFFGALGAIAAGWPPLGVAAYACACGGIGALIGLYIEH